MAVRAVYIPPFAKARRMGHPSFRGWWRAGHRSAGLGEVIGGAMSEAFSRGDNPWRCLPEHPRYVLTADEEFVQRHNRHAPPKHTIQVNALPEPFIGDPNSAKLVLLNLNPGYKPSVDAHHGRPEIKEAIFRNLRQEQEQEKYPFYAFSPTFGKTAEFEQTGVAKWWRKRTHRLQEATGLANAAFAKKIFVIEWFPYPSENWFYTAKKFAATGKPLCPSQAYSFQLARSFLGDDRVVVLGMRSKDYWVIVDKRFEYVPFLNSPQNTCITPGNMERGLFDKIVKLMAE